MSGLELRISRRFEPQGLPSARPHQPRTTLHPPHAASHALTHPHTPSHIPHTPLRTLHPVAERSDANPEFFWDDVGLTAVSLRAGVLDAAQKMREADRQAIYLEAAFSGVPVRHAGRRARSRRVALGVAPSLSVAELAAHSAYAQRPSELWSRATFQSLLGARRVTVGGGSEAPPKRHRFHCVWCLDLQVSRSTRASCSSRTLRSTPQLRRSSQCSYRPPTFPSRRC